jgi:transcriptional regulator with XRE-family HTH domain
MTADAFDALNIPESVALYVGRRLSVARVRAKITQADLARALNVDSAITSLWERDRRPIPHNRVDQVAAVLKTTARALLEDAATRRYRQPPDKGMAAFVVPPLPEPVREPTTPPPSARLSWSWCTSSHGSGVKAPLHHHGLAPFWAPGVGRIDM